VQNARKERFNGEERKTQKRHEFVLVSWSLVAKVPAGMRKDGEDGGM